MTGNLPLPWVVRDILNPECRSNLLQCFVLPANQDVALTIVLDEFVNCLRNFVHVVTINRVVE